MAQATTEPTTEEAELLGAVPLKGGDEVRVYRVQWGKYSLLDVRRWVPATDGGPVRHIPTPKGLRVQLAHWGRLLPILTGAVQGFLAELEGDADDHA